MSDKENRRKCFKCGSSPAEDGVKLFRFVKPGTRNLLRCELWAKYIFPEREYSSIELQRKLYTEHRVLCERHFKDEDFTDETKKRLLRNAVPYDAEPTKRTYSSVGHIMQGSALGNISNLLPGPSMSGTSMPSPSMTGQSKLGPSMPEPAMSGPCMPSPSMPGQSEPSPSMAEPSMSGPCMPSPSMPGQSKPGPSIAKPSMSGPCMPSPSISGQSKPGPSLAEPSMSGPCMPSQSIPGQSKPGPSMAEPSMSGPCMPSPSMPGQSKPGPSMAEPSMSGPCMPSPSMPGQSKPGPSMSGPCMPSPSMPEQSKLGPSMAEPSMPGPTIPGLSIGKGPSKPGPSKTGQHTASHSVAATSDREHQLLQKCRKYMNQVCQLRHRIKNLKNKEIIRHVSEDKAVKKLSKKITPAFALLLQGHLRNIKRKKTGRRWSKDEKITALQIYKRSPTCYRLLCRLFPLPSISTLKTLLRRLPFGVGVNESIFNVLKSYVATQPPGDNYYTLMFDEMSIKKHLQYNPKDDIIEGYQDHGVQGRSPVEATYALVFMIAGIRKRVKQPIAHYFSSGNSTADRLAVLIKEVLLQCFRAGINIVATVCDMDGVNRRALSILGSTVQKPSITFQGKEIITFFDTPHLLKCFRNLFLKYDIEMTTSISSEGKVGKGIAKWSHIKEFYEVDNTNRNFVFAPVLTKEHLDPNAKQKMKVNLAAQVLSHSVAGGMLARISNGEITADATVTATLVSDIDKLFDLLNSDSPDLRRGKPHATNWSPTSPHEEFLKKMKKFFEEMKFVGSPRRPPSQEGWITTINAFFLLKRKLNADNIKTLATRRIQQDPIENLFGCIRGNCGSNTNPTCNQFVAGLKTALLSNLSHMGTKGNCETDNVTIMNNMNKFLSVSRPAATRTEVEMLDLPEVREEDIEENNAEFQACAYVCGFIVKKCKQECEACAKMLISDNIEPHHSFVECREYDSTKKGLNYVSAQMIKCVEMSATITNHILSENSHKNCLKSLIIQNIKENVNFDFLQNCMEHKDSNVELILNCVFNICTKRFCILKNRSFSAESSATALKRKMKIIVHK